MARSIQDTLEMQKCFSELSQAGRFCHDDGVHAPFSLERKITNKFLKDLSLFQNENILEDLQFALTSLQGKLYNLFGVEPLHDLHLAKSELLNRYVFKFPGSERVLRKLGGVLQQRQPLSRMSASILRGINSLLAAVDQNADVPDLLVDFPIKIFSMRLNDLFQNSGVRVMFKWKDYPTVDMVFLFLGAYIDRARKS